MSIPKNRPKKANGRNPIEYNPDGTIKASFLKATWTLKDWKACQKILREKVQNGDKAAALFMMQMMGGTPAPNKPDIPTNHDPVTDITFEIVQPKDEKGRFAEKPKDKEYKVDEVKTPGDKGILREQPVQETEGN